MQGPNGLSISVRFKESNLKESDTLRMSDIHRHILQAIRITAWRWTDFSSTATKPRPPPSRSSTMTY